MRCCAFKPAEIHLCLQIFSAVVFAGVGDLWVGWFYLTPPVATSNSERSVRLCIAVAHTVFSSCFVLTADDCLEHATAM